MLEKRFTINEDDDGSWSVVDAETDGPTVVRDKPLVRLAEAEARDAANLLNMIERMRVQQPMPAQPAVSSLHPFLNPLR